ncbi:RNA polymerase factor sigma-54 [Hahella sp. CCB-MM4]|uniref:RNA polymerase factor sigma-54 n=1 Tax=Hahella sp. (strain CCB-MM4) TaxID=1926491 RepID=UPI000B9BBDC3|nr:RNA polymerase factor sigma-54 [Hahella sp. CCB-MM4]OZG70577.1 RNA polymerase factor sigma-54 [Hahella sp. CCB-MM4]
MKTSLQLKLGQQLTMTPQLQQAIKLLQLSTLDLQQEIQQALESNPMLEVNEDDEPSSNPQNDEITERLVANAKESASESASSSEEPSYSEDDNWNESIPNDLPVDTAWDDVYQGSNTSYSSGSEDDEFDFESRNSKGETLQDHLLWQLNLTPMSDTDRVIAIAIVDAVSPDGYLTLTAEEIHSGLETEGEEGIELDEVQAVLKRVQQFDPPGVATNTLQECLLNQLNQLPKDTPWLGQAKLVVSHYINLLGNRDYAQLMRRSRLKEEDLRHVLKLIQGLNPKPGQSIQESETEYVVPDVMVRKTNGRWLVELNPEISPRIRVNPGYASLVKRADSSADNTYLRDQLQEARWFIKSLQSRNETLLKVASQIVEHQQGFLDYGEEAMKPLVLHDIAEAVEMHESTISRVTTQKYMHTPRGVFELKYFFSSHVSTDSGGECSSTAIRAIIKKLVAAESPKKPLSDSKIAALLGEQGINVARRTIAKYREALSIPPSNERKRLI